MYPEQFERAYLRRGRRTRAEEQAALGRARRVAAYMVGFALAWAAAMAVAIKVALER